MSTETRICDKCETELSLASFRSKCKTCKKCVSKAMREKKVSKWEEKIVDGNIICVDCSVAKPIDQFPKYIGVCKECRKPKLLEAKEKRKAEKASQPVPVPKEKGETITVPIKKYLQLKKTQWKQKMNTAATTQVPIAV